VKNGLLRIITAIVGIPVVVGMTYLGGTAFTVMVAIIALAAQFEFYTLQKKTGFAPSVIPGLVAGLIILLPVVSPLAKSLLILVVLWVLIDLLSVRGATAPVSRLAATIAGVVYPVWLFSFLTPIRSGLEMSFDATVAFRITMMLFSIIWATDTAAYYTGKSLGKHKLAPSISPKKTWEGSIGGIMGALVAVLIFKTVWLAFLTWMDVAALALIGGVVSQIGDLVESRFKRSAGVKDSAGLLPGHGGFLDRFDGMILSFPVYYLYFVHVAGYIG